MAHELLETIRERFYYDNGVVRVKKAGQWKGKKDEVAGSARPKDSRIIIQVKRQRLFAHQIVWLLFNEDLPENSIDHADTDCTNNHIENLRAASRSEQQRNKPIQVNNSTGFKGVSFRSCVKAKPWRAAITVANKVKHLGYFETATKAAVAYDMAAKKHFGAFAYTNF